MTIFLGNTMDRTITTAVYLDPMLTAPYAVRMYSSLNAEWVESRLDDIRDLKNGHAVQLDGKGFCVIELRQGA